MFFIRLSKNSPTITKKRQKRHLLFKKITVISGKMTFRTKLIV